MKRRILLMGLLLLAVCINAEETTDAQNEPKERGRIFSGFSIGVIGNIGYAFAGSPEDMYNNGTFTNLDGYQNLSRKGVTLGAGVMGRIHLIDHLHVGAEGYVSTMPLMESGSGIRHGYAGALIDGYLTAGKVVLMAGTGIGGGKVKRMFVPEKEPEIVEKPTDIVYNASYTATPYFYLDPYVGMEINIGALVGVLIKLDYQLPFGKSDDGIFKSFDLKGWSSFISPSGPRLHVGFLIGK